MKQILKTVGVVLGSVLFVTLILVNLWSNREQKAVGSVADGQGYVATSTKSADGTILPNYSLVMNGPGTFGSVVITGANTGVMYFYDATTTDKTLRTNQATTTIATFPASTAAGTYTFDAVVNYGVVYQLVVGVTPTSTITTRK